jgi:hypothetical protein
MCGLCGILSDDRHWEGLWQLADEAERARVHRNERLDRVRYLNRLLGAFSCSVSDWQGSAYLLSTFTGKTEIVQNLPQLWTSVQRLTGHVADPLLDGIEQRLRAEA